MKKIKIYDEFISQEDYDKIFNDYFKPFNEAFNSPSDIEWVDTGNSLNGQFLVNGDLYDINCDDLVDNIWTYKFTYSSGTGSSEKTHDLIDNESNKFKTLSTIRKGMKYLLDNKKPNGIIIVLMDDSRGREYVWGRFSKEISESYGYQLYKNNFMECRFFMLWKDIPFEKMNEAFTLLIRNYTNYMSI